VAALVDTNVLVYRFDPGNPPRQHRAREIVLEGARSGELVLPHQALIEFVAVTTRPRSGRAPLLSPREAMNQVERLLVDFEILYPDARVVRMAFNGVSSHGLSWYDAHLWAYAVVHAIPELLTEDLQDGGNYGGVLVVNPFRGL
jgi:predicted nucleic acid-binding protein